MRNIFYRLKLFDTQSDQPIKFKLLVHEMVIRSKLLYGLESAALTDGALTQLNTFQLKGIRRILGAVTTYRSKTCANEFLMEKTNQHTGPSGKNNKELQRNAQLDEDKILHKNI